MYSALKKLIKKIIPNSFLVKNEALFRQLTYLFYKGSSFKCNVCEAGLSKFVELPTGDLLCPKCGSLPRTRRLWHILLPLIKNKNSLLHFSPSRVLYRKLKSRKGLNYVSTDFEDEFIADQKLDIRSTGLDQESFGLIVCFHVLEHIDEDQKAIKELFRILKTGGICLIQTPFKEGDIYEDPSITQPEEREKHFGQNDHVRIYSVSGLQSRLERAGFIVNVRQFENPSDHLHGFKNNETILYCHK